MFIVWTMVRGLLTGGPEMPKNVFGDSDIFTDYGQFSL